MPSTKIMLVGDSKVGKTAIQKRYCIVNKVNKFFAALIHEIEVRQLEKAEKKDWKTRGNKLIFLTNSFRHVHDGYINKMLDVFNQALVPVSIACFFAENGYADKLLKCFPSLSEDFWLRCSVPLQVEREQLNLDVMPEIEAEFARYTQMMRKFQQGEYSALLTVDLKCKQDFGFEANEYVPTYEPTANKMKTENGDVIVCDMPAVDDWKRFPGRFMQFGFTQFGLMIDAILLVYDIGNRNSFDQIERYWRQLEAFKIQAKLYGVEEPVFMLVGNKSDLAGHERKVGKLEGKNRAICFDMPFMEVSARENVDIESAFITLSNAVKKKRYAYERKKAEKKDEGKTAIQKTNLWEALTISIEEEEMEETDDEDEAKKENEENEKDEKEEEENEK